MSQKTDTTPPWQDLEKQAYHAYREWHLWLMLRLRELDERVRTQSVRQGKEKAKSRPPEPARTGAHPARKPSQSGT